jgi:hypothetical protein
MQLGLFNTLLYESLKHLEQLNNLTKINIGIRKISIS